MAARRKVKHTSVEGGYEFPGCRPIRIPRSEIEDYEGRIEYWDGDTEIAWQVCEPTSFYHEGPGQRLGQMAERIAAARGAPISAYGSTDLQLRDGSGQLQRLMQADQILYMNPSVARPFGRAVVIGQTQVPDVVLEVDLTTDVRRGKLSIYESWALPELWVDVPERRLRSSPSRRARPPGLTIHLLGEHGYQTVSASRAFPGWTASEIHDAINADTLTDEMSETLLRIGNTLAARGFTGPDDDPFLRILRDETRVEGRAEGRLEGRAEERRSMLHSLLAARGIATTPRLEREFGLIANAPVSRLTQVAMNCLDEEDFLRQIANAHP